MTELDLNPFEQEKKEDLEELESQIKVTIGFVECVITETLALITSKKVEENEYEKENYTSSLTGKN